MSDDRGTGDGTKREAALLEIRAWFGPAFKPDEVLVAALAATLAPLTSWRSVLAGFKALVGQNQARVLLLTDQAIHIVSRKLWLRRFKGLLVTYPLRTVPVTVDGRALRISDQRFHLYVGGFQLRGGVGGQEDVQLFLGATGPG